MNGKSLWISDTNQRFFAKFNFDQDIFNTTDAISISDTRHSGCLPFRLTNRSVHGLGKW